MEEEIYGITPRANIVSLDNDPPENKLNRPKMPPLLLEKISANLVASNPGTGICAPILYTINARTKNNKRPFNSDKPL